VKIGPLASEPVGLRRQRQKKIKIKNKEKTSAKYIALLASLPSGLNKVTGYSSSQQASPLRELTCHMGLHSVTCHPAEVTFPPLPQPIKAGTRFATQEGCKAELT